MVALYAGTKPIPAEQVGTGTFTPVTNAVESLNRSLRKITKTRGSFPTDEAALKLLFLAIRNAGVHWRRPIEWTAAVGQFAILFGDRFEPSAR
jgi:putative transposase